MALSRKCRLSPCRPRPTTSLRRRPCNHDSPELHAPLARPPLDPPTRQAQKHEGHASQGCDLCQIEALAELETAADDELLPPTCASCLLGPSLMPSPLPCLSARSDNWMYIIQDSAGNSAAVVDPYNAAGVQQEVEKQGVKVRALAREIDCSSLA